MRHQHRRLSRFADYLRSSRSISGTTVNNYVSCVGRALPPDTLDPDAWSAAVLDAARLDAHLRTLNDVQRASARVAWGHFHAFAASQGVAVAALPPTPLQAMGAVTIANPPRPDDEPIAGAVFDGMRRLYRGYTGANVHQVQELRFRHIVPTGNGWRIDPPRVGPRSKRALTLIPEGLYLTLRQRGTRDGETEPPPDRLVFGRRPGSDEPYPLSVIRAALKDVPRTG
jgi:hypothetical protein